MWSVRCSRCRCIHYLIRGRASRQMNRRGWRVDVCNNGSRRIPLLRAVVVAAVVVVAVTIVVAVVVVVVAVGGVLPGECVE